MNAALLWSLFLTNAFTPSPPGNPAQTASPYCNEKFAFCAEYPSSILNFEATLVQDNGIVLKSTDGLSEVVIAGYQSAFNKSTEESFRISIQNLLPPGKQPTIISSLFGEDFYECFFMIGHNMYFHRSYHFDDHFVRVEIRTPINRPHTMEKLREGISIDFNVETPVKTDKPTSSLMNKEMRE
ncbi:MAG TPA: hypothetical protein ENJ95_11040 [Bacteroidetes bacterium]|nr:hypothetical protein [Bacteroidota bacterium]